MSSMMTRLTTVETMLKASNAELELKNSVIEKQRAQIAQMKLTKSADEGNSIAVEALTSKCARLQAQLSDMERFLADYGMVWVGDDADADADAPEPGPAGGASSSSAAEAAPTGPSMWMPRRSTPGPAKITAMEYDKIIANVAELNELAGEGTGTVSSDRNGAQRIKMKEAVPVRLYKNGIFMFGGPFRPLEDMETQACVRDLTDGYFPTELQGRYPSGVPLEIVDLRDEVYAEGRPAFGRGRTLGGRVQPSRLVPTSATKNRPVSKEAFLNQLPKAVIKSGKVIDVRSGLAEHLTAAVGGVQVAVVETPVVAAMKERLAAAPDEQPAGAGRPATPVDITTIQVKLPGHRLILKLRFTDTVAALRSAIDAHRDGASVGYKLQNSYPRRVFDDPSVTLVDAGLTPNATVHLIPAKAP